jgi:ADP-heptose:LPS heptosyltransferase
VLLAAPKTFRELALWTGAVDEIVPTSRLGEVNELKYRPGLAINLHGSGPESIGHLLRLAPERLLTHQNAHYPELDGPVWDCDTHEVDRWCGLLEWAGIRCRPQDLTLDRPFGYRDRSGVVVVHPGAAAAARRWPAERFAAVVAALRQDGHDVVVTGSAEERALALSVACAGGLPESAVLAGVLDLLGLVALICDARLLICGDTGVGHVATATGTPSVLLFGPTPPSRWGPRGSGPHLALWSGDVGDPHAAEPHSGLLALDVSRVLDASRTALRECA